MSEDLIGRLADWLKAGPTVLACVLETRGATPRHPGSLMLVGATDSLGSIGGGEAESRTLTAARALLAGAERSGGLEIDLSGSPGAAGVCGGRMQVALRRWAGSPDLERVQALARRLHDGHAIELNEHDLGVGGASQRIHPDPRLLIIGAGHCGMALYQLARHLDFELAVFDPRPSFAASERFPGARVWSGSHERLADALDTRREVWAVLLSRDFHADVAALRTLSLRPPRFIGMMGSRRRVAAVRQALADCRLDLDGLHAPVGIEIAAETPHEIAVSILAELIAFRRRPGRTSSGQEVPPPPSAKG